MSKSCESNAQQRAAWDSVELLKNHIQARATSICNGTCPPWAHPRVQGMRCFGFYRSQAQDYSMSLVDLTQWHLQRYRRHPLSPSFDGPSATLPPTSSPAY